MLLLVTIGLVVVGAIALLIGFVSNSLGPIYVSIACSVIAGGVLVVFSRMARRSEAVSSGPSMPSASPGSWSPAAAAPSAPSTPRATSWDRPSTPPPAAAPPPPPPPPPRPEPADEPTATMPRVGAMAGPAPVADDFPIPDYDTLRASQIIEKLSALDLDELDMVQEREEQTKNRATILRRVVERIELLEAEEDVAVAAAAPAGEEFAAAADDEFPEPAPADDDFPIAEYDSLSAAEIIAVLDDLEDEELDLVAEREERGQNRAEILDYIDDMFEEVEEAEPAPASAPAAAPAPKAPAKKALAKKGGTVKKVADKKAAAVKKAPAKKAAAPRVPAVKAAPAKKASPPAPAGRSAVAKKLVASPGTKSAAAAKKAAPAAKAAGASVKKAPAKKASAPTRKR